MKQIGEIVKKKELNSSTVNSSNKYLSTVNSKTDSQKIKAFLENERIKPEGVAQTLAEGLDDKESLAYYLILAKESRPERLLEALSYTQDTERRGKIRTKKAIYFQAILRRWGIKTKFKKR